VPFGNSGYVVLYRYDGSHVVILAVRHAREAGYQNHLIYFTPRLATNQAEWAERFAKVMNSS
jgi:ParE toxin of type II toxin-antitoxin system, parDE